MLTELTVVLCGDVDLVVIGTNHLTAQVVTIIHLQLGEVCRIQIVECRIVTVCRCVEVLTATITAVHSIQVV